MIGDIGGALGLGAGRVARVIASDIATVVGAPRRVLVVGDGLVRALVSAGLPVIAIVKAAKRRRGAPPSVVASGLALPFGDGAVDAACVAGMPAGGIAALREVARVVRDGGYLALATAASALVRRVAPPEVAAATLVHAGLVDIEQEQLGATLLTTARVRAWRRRARLDPARAGT